MPKFLV